MITLGEGFSEGSEWLVAYQDFRGADKASLDAIAEAEKVTLSFRTDREMGRLGETHLLVNSINTELTHTSVWCKTGVSSANVVIDIVLNPDSWTESRSIARRIAQMRETLAHEWGLHGEKFWNFIEWMRTQPSGTEKEVERIAERYNRLGDTEHDELAAGTHERFTAIMSKLLERNAENEDLVAALRQAWDDDITLHKRSAKSKEADDQKGKEKAKLEKEKAKLEEEGVLEEEELEMTKEEQAALDQFLEEG